MDTRIAVIGIIVENPDSVERLNDILHQYSPYILGRMAFPIRNATFPLLVWSSMHPKM